jgi:hypothetical protein
MPHWLIKSAIQRTISLLPASQTWNSLFQQYVTRSLELTASRFEARLHYCRLHLEHFLELRPDRTQDFTVVEVGTGWYPVVPVGLYLCGASEVQTFDIDPLLQTGRLTQMRNLFLEYDRTGALGKYLPRLRPERVARLREIGSPNDGVSAAALLKRLNIYAHVRGAEATGLPAEKTDLFVSTGVLEYIPPETLKAILAEFKRLGSPRATQSHYLNLVDQYSYFDSSITPFNFLQYSSSRWKYLNSPLTWQNRMRISDFREMFTQAGYQVTKEINTSGTLQDLEKIRLAPEFQHHSKEDLLVLTSWLIAKPQRT